MEHFWELITLLEAPCLDTIQEGTGILMRSMTLPLEIFVVCKLTSVGYSTAADHQMTAVLTDRHVGVSLF